MFGFRVFELFVYCVRVVYFLQGVFENFSNRGSKVYLEFFVNQDIKDGV